MKNNSPPAFEVLVNGMKSREELDRTALIKNAGPNTGERRKS